MNKKKYEKPVNLDMSFDEAMQRLSNVKKTEVESKIKRNNSKKRKQ